MNVSGMNSDGTVCATSSSSTSSSCSSHPSVLHTAHIDIQPADDKNKGERKFDDTAMIGILVHSAVDGTYYIHCFIICVLSTLPMTNHQLRSASYSTATVFFFVQ